MAVTTSSEQLTGSEESGYDMVVTRYGRPAVEVLADRVALAKGGDTLAPVTVLVPSNYAAVATRRALAGRPGGVAGVTFLTVHRLAQRLGGGALAAAGRLPVATPVIGAAVRAELAEDPGVFGPVAAHEATELALVAATREMADCTEDALDAVAASGQRAADVVGIARRVRRRLAADWHDEQDLLRSAVSAVRSGASLTPTITHLLQSLSPAAGELLAAVAERTRVAVVIGLTGDAEADAPVLAAHRRAGIIAVPSPDPDGPGATPPAAGAVSASDPDDEVRAAVRLVTDWMRDGGRLGHMALLYGSPEPYARLLHQHLTAADLPSNGAPVTAVGDLLLGRTLRAVLALPDRSWRRDDVLAVLAGSLIRAGDGLAHTRAWERVSRVAGVVADGDWSARLAAFAAEQRERAREAEADEEQAWRAAALRRAADDADDLAGWVAGLRREVAGIAAAGSWRAMVDRTTRLIERLLGTDRHRWPAEERDAAHRVEESLDRLADLDAVAGPPPTIDTFRRALDGELAAALPRVGRLGDGILVGPVSLAPGLQLDRVVVLGLAEGSFPPRRLEDSVLPDDERRAAGGQLALRTERHHDDHRHLLAAVAAADRAVLAFPRGDLRRQGDRSPSRWLLDQAGAATGRLVTGSEDLRSLTGHWLVEVPSHVAGLCTAAFPATAQDLRVAAMLTDPATVVTADRRVRRGTELARARMGDAFTRFDGNLAHLADHLPDHTAGDRSSATRLETWANCPHAYLVRYLLGVQPAEDPVSQRQIDPLARGRLVHEILERFVGGRLGSAGPWTAAVAELRAAAEDVFADYDRRGLTGRPVMWSRDRAAILDDLDRFAAEDRGRPLAVEHRFDSACIDLPDGRTVAFRGSIDRLDDTGPGSAAVIDYKTGRADPYRGLGPDDPHQGGRRLQLAVYAAAAADLGRPVVDARYWFVTDKGGFAAVGYRVDDRVRRRVGEALATIVDGIAGGVFPRRPAERDPWGGHVDCWYCTPDGGSAADARRQWERKRTDPSLAAYVALADAGGDR